MRMSQNSSRESREALWLGAWVTLVTEEALGDLAQDAGVSVRSGADLKGIRTEKIPK